jgi:tRNA U34 5-carboxymethylaminomethyl modifying enzyme MnmG/GidA
MPVVWLAGSVEDLILEEGEGGMQTVRGILTASGDSILAPNVVITTGKDVIQTSFTFLGWM